MKKVSFLGLLVLMVMFLSGCGKDGVDGKDGAVYVGFTWVGTVSYADNISETPLFSVVDPYLYYKITPGTYMFQYIHNSLNPYYQWTQTYNFAADLGTKGTQGSFMQDGEDGEDGIDLYYKIGLWSDGPIVYQYTSPYKSINSKSSNSDQADQNEIIEKINKEKGLLKNPNTQDILVIKELE